MNPRAVTALALTIFAVVATPVSADESHQWALWYLRADQVWRISKGAGTTVAVIDSGVQVGDDVPTALIPGADFSDGSGRSTGDGLTDTNPDGHGTGMAVLIGGSGKASHGAGTIGLSLLSTILPIRASAASSTGLALRIAPALDYAISHNATVINLSLSTGTLDDPDIRTAVQSAVDHDIVIVAAIDEIGTNAQNYPASYPGVLAVGAIDQTGAVWSRSNYGPEVGIVAPGVHIYRDDNQNRQGYSDGTSEATAYVSAAAALLRSAHPTWTAPQIVAALKATADKPTSMNNAIHDDHYGAGILNPLAALHLTNPPGETATTPPPATSPTPTPPPTPYPESPTTAAIQKSASSRKADSSGAFYAILIGGATLIVSAVLLVAATARRRTR